MKKGLIMEGGAMRGLFTCGVLDVLMENDITFDGAIGISAGAVFGCNFKSHQHGRPLRYNTNFAKDPRFGTFRSWLKTGDLYDVDLCYREIPEELDPFDAETFARDPLEFYVGATDAKSGKCLYHLCSDGGDEDMQWMRASASLPLVSRPVVIKGKELLDGGIADSIPFRFMEEQGYDRNLIILTQPKGYRKRPNKLVPLMKIVLKKYPFTVKALADRHLVYNEQVRQVEERERTGQSFVIRPPYDLGIGRTEHDVKELRRVYELGRQEALNKLEELKEFLSAEQLPIRKRPSEKIRREYRFQGKVQGVGFRFQAMMAADQLGLTGLVRNEDDGSVTMEIQGNEEAIEACLGMIGNSRYITITKQTCRNIPLKEEERGFRADY